MTTKVKQYLLKRLKAKQGMTLVEMVISLTIFSLISTGIASMFFFVTRVYSEHTAMVNEQSELRLILSELVGELSLATDILISNRAESNIDYEGQIHPLSLQASISGTGVDAQFQIRKASGEVQYPYRILAEDLQLTLSGVDADNPALVRVKLATKHYALEQEVFCRNCPAPYFDGTGPYSFVSYVAPIKE